MFHAEKTVQSIYNQTRVPDVVRWHVPYYSERQKRSYPALPPWIQKFPTLKIVRCEDDGPSTKVTPALDDKSVGPHDRLLIFDDDVEYHKEAVQVLVEAAGGDDHVAVGFMGHTFVHLPFMYGNRAAQGKHKQPRWFNRVRVLMGTGMMLFPRRALPSHRKEWLVKLHQDARYFLNDDHVLCQFAWRHHVKMYLVHRPWVIEEMDHGEHDDRLTGTNRTRDTEWAMIRNGDMPLPWPELTLGLLFCLLMTALVVWLIWR